jgi:hypothetical protein
VVLSIAAEAGPIGAGITSTVEAGYAYSSCYWWSCDHTFLTPLVLRGFRAARSRRKCILKNNILFVVYGILHRCRRNALQSFEF